MGPEDMSRLNYILGTFRKIYERYGFQPMETPAVEGFDLLSAKGGYGEAVKDEIYFFKDKSDRELGLRFDLTLPLVRFYLNNPNIPKPFKRYAQGKVWRYDNPQSQRYREFWQSDVDILGSQSPLADAECIAATVDCLRAIGIEDFKIRVNNRKLLEGLLIKLGIEASKVIQVFRSVDKLDKIGIDGVNAELGKIGIEDSEVLLSLLSMKGNYETIIQKINELGVYDGIEELEIFFKLSKKLGTEKWLILDLSLVRGLDYYTGLVFEISIGKERVSCGGGGRLDKLVKSLDGPDTPATGISLGVDRILNTLETNVTQKSVFIANATDDTFQSALDICTQLRKNGIPSSIDLMQRNLSKQMNFAASLKIPIVVIVGNKELSESLVKVRDMSSGEETSVKLADLEKELKTRLKI